MSSYPNLTIFASPIPEQLIRVVAEKTERKIKKNLRIHNRENFLLVDGSDITGSDTPGNQEEYPQPESQAEGCGFPMMRVLILTSLITGMVRAAAMGVGVASLRNGNAAGGVVGIEQAAGRRSRGTAGAASREATSEGVPALVTKQEKTPPTVHDIDLNRCNI